MNIFYVHYIMPPLTHGRVYNDFRSGIEHIKDQNGNTKAILQRTLRPLPGLMRTSTNGKDETARIEGASNVGNTGLPAAIRRRYGSRRWLYLRPSTTRKRALTSGTVGTSAAVKRAWARRSRYSASQNRPRDPEGALIYKSEKACPGPGNRNPFPPHNPPGT